MLEQIAALYPEYSKIYGPYVSRKNGRKLIHLVASDGRRVGISFGKLLLEVKIGRRLLENETADHINCDRTDDRFENLQLLDRAKHAALDVVRLELPDLECIWCGSTFRASRNHLCARKKQKAGPFCSRKCTGQYGASVCYGSSTLGRKLTERTYYTNKNGSVAKQKTRAI